MPIPHDARFAHAFRLEPLDLFSTSCRPSHNHNVSTVDAVTPCPPRSMVGHGLPSLMRRGHPMSPDIINAGLVALIIIGMALSARVALSPDQD